MKKELFSKLTFCIMVLACASCSSMKPIATNDLKGCWVLDEMQQQKADTLFGGKVPTIEFDMAKMHLSGTGGCNRYMGGFDLDKKNHFLTKQVASTMMMCPNEQQEGGYLKLLAKKTLTLSLSSDKNHLFVADGKQMILSYFKFMPEALYGDWVLESMDGQPAATLFTTKLPSLQLGKDGMASGNAGCNTYRAGYSFMDGQLLKMAQPMTTRMACPDLAHETTFLNYMSSYPTIKLVDGKLMLSVGGKMVLTFVRKK